MFNQLMKVSQGFKLVYVGLLIVILAIVLGIVGTVVLGIVAAPAVAPANVRGGVNPGAAANGAAVLQIFAGLLGLALVGGNIVGLIGKFLCLSVPDKAGEAKPLIFISIGLELASMAAGIVNQLIPVVNLRINPTIAQILPLLLMLAQLTSSVLFLLFTKAVAQFIRRSDLGDSAMSVLWLFGTAIGCYLVGIAIVFVGMFAGGAGAVAGAGNAAAGGFVAFACIGGILTLVGVVFALIGLVRFISLMKDMNEATARYARGIRKLKGSKSKKRQQDYEEEDDDEEEEEEEEEAPRRRKRRPVRDEDEEEDEEPRPRKRRPTRDDD